ncbi:MULTISPECIES: protein-L-isoaspartate(D-aspartate) O-methyltransferase [Rhodonellum]|nr:MULTISPECIES: protein-L-isoaspartate(D-aspartate) O-methyltransferase [Rhodonellum]SDZ56725.1 protein-L-isoaspartate(D-aspartate) O-methyltransferase [Rhodonellum ikkaensis]
MKYLPIFLMFFILQTDPYQSKREQMVKTQIVARGISNREVIEAMLKVERHKLVPENMRANAYSDSPLPIGGGQTISQPYIVAYMTDILRPKPGMTVLEVGTGSGYQAAVLAEIVKEVYTIEIVAQLGLRAEKALKAMGYDNIHVKIGDGYQGWPEKGPFDAIIVTAAAQKIPPPLIAQLNEGGRMIIPVGPSGGAQQLMLVEKSKGKTKITKMLPVRFVPFTRDSLQHGESSTLNMH